MSGGADATPMTEDTDAGTVWRGIALLFVAQLGMALLVRPGQPPFVVPAALTMGTVGLLMTFRGVRFRTRARARGFLVALGITWLVVMGLGLAMRGAWWLLTRLGGA